MKKITGILLIVLLLLSAAFVAATFYVGRNAEKTLAERSAAINRSGLIEVVSRSYERHWFSAKENLTVRIRPHLLHKINNSLPQALQTFLQEPVQLISTVRHGPWLGNHFGQASVHTDIIFSDKSAKTVKQLFGDVQAVHIHDDISWNGSGSLKVSVSPFDYQELSGIHWIWRGLNTQTRYSRHYQHYDTELTAPGMKLTLADLGELSWKNLSYKTHHEDNNILPTGNSVLALQHFDMKWHKTVDYRLRLNDLINIISGLQIGGFINPQVSVPPSSIVLDDFSLHTSMTVNNGSANGSGKIMLKKMQYGDDAYENLSVEVSAEHINAAALQALKRKIADIAESDENRWRDLMLNALRNEGAPIFTDNPVFKLKSLLLDTPDGKINVQAELAFNHVQKEDLYDIHKLTPKMILQAQYDVPQALPESFAQNQIQQIFKADNDEDFRDMQETVRLMVHGSLKELQDKGYIKLDKNQLSGSLKLENGKFFMNNNMIESSPEEEIEEESSFLDEESDVASETEKYEEPQIGADLNLPEVP